LREERRLKVNESGELKRVLGPTRMKYQGSEKKLHNEEFTEVYPSPNIIRVMKSRRMKRAGHVSYMG